MKNTIIKTKNLCRSFVTGKTSNNVLKNIDLDIYEGDFTIIMGSSGSGKSTLLYSLSTMDKPTSGSVNVLGKEITQFSNAATTAMRRKDISFVWQSMNLLSDINVFENIAYCGYNCADKKIVHKNTEELLKKLDLYDAKDKYPSEISGGMRQRVAIARALITNPKIIFGDEPTGALNSTMGQEVLDLLSEQNNNGQSIVMVTHDLKAATRATRLLYLADGRIVGDLNLGHYTKETAKEREGSILAFLKKNNW